MKKGINILLASFILSLSGCAIKFERVGAEPEPIVKVAPIKEVKPAVPECKTCTSNTVKKKALRNCSETVRTIVYKETCTQNCGFPVSVRVPTNCKGSM